MAQEVFVNETPVLGALSGKKLGKISPAKILAQLSHISPQVPVGAKRLLLKPNAITERLINTRGLWMGAAVMAIAVWFAEVINSTNTSTKVNLNFNGMAPTGGLTA